jgi:6-phosphogluconate dehydrogenase
MSAMKDERVNASKILKGPKVQFRGDKPSFMGNLRHALYTAKICSYAQGFSLMRAASKENQWNLNFGDTALLWRGGCIIRAAFLDRIKKAFNRAPDLPNLLLDPYFKSAVGRGQSSLRRVVAQTAKLGIPVPAFSTALAYYDSYRSEQLPANLLQAQRDFFGAHTYERIDKPRGQFFHSEWS